MSPSGDKLSIKMSGVTSAVKDLEFAKLRAASLSLIMNNGGPLQSYEAVEGGREDDYIMVRLSDFEALCAALGLKSKNSS